MKYSLGIDLGTTFSAVAVVDETGRPRIVNNSQGRPVTPSVIYFGGDEPVVGDEAKEMQALGDSEVASFFKRSMGDSKFILNFNGRDYTPVDLSAIVLRKLKGDAEDALGCPVDQAVITVPAYFNNFQREATIRAGEMAGLKVMRIINEPTAAALAYGMKEGCGSRTVLVYDLGGGTFDVTIVRITGTSIEVAATDGDHELGGKDWDDRIITDLGQRFLAGHGVDPLEDLIAFNDLLVRAENAKKQLSTRERARLSISFRGEKEIYEITRSGFQEMTSDLMERTVRLTEKVIQDAGLKWQNIDDVLLVGGSTRMPAVGQYVEKMSGKKPLPGVNVDEAVAIGAAIQASIDAADAEKEGAFFTISGVKRMRDVISHSLGMVAVNEDNSRYINSIIIPRNRPIPCSETRPYQIGTVRNRKNKVEVYMLQGESEKPLDCHILGKYVFSDITHVPDKPAVLDIEYIYDHNGVVSVSTTERKTGKKLPLKIESVPGDMTWLSLPPEEKQAANAYLSVLIAIDLSGSMYGSPLREAQKAARKFVEEIDLNHSSIGLIAFADSVRVTRELCRDAGSLDRGIDEWSVGMVGGGNSAEPFSAALRELQNVEDPRFLIVLTDGVWAFREEAIRLAQSCHEEGIEIIAIGFGGADKNFLQAVATSEEGALLTDLSGLVTSFSRIAQVLTESGGGLRVGDAYKTKKKLGFLSFFTG